MSRLPPIDVGALTAEQRQVWDTVTKGRRDVFLGPTQAWVTSPALAQRAHEMGAYCRYGSSLPARLSELAILTMAAHWKSKFEWFAHYHDGIAAGLDPVTLEAIRCGSTPGFSNEDEVAVYTFARELLNDKRVSEAGYSSAMASLGTRGVVDLVAVLGFYGLVSMTLNSFEIGLPPGAEDPFP